jgi:hypothetical protein
MALFQDSATQKIWSFDSNVTVAIESGIYVFSVNGVTLATPSTLQPFDGVPPAVIGSPTLPQQAAELLSAGLTITSTSTPAIDGTYPATPNAVSYVQAEMLSILANGTFADGATTLQWADATGALHTFPSVAVFKLFATAIGTFVAAATKVQIGASTILPPSSVTIA